jgi:histidine phosphotransferase ChpT
VDKETPVADIDFAALLCSRLCHDLVSPVGALTNGIELLADETDPVMREQCLQLLADSARQTANRLKFFRLAFGAASGMGPDVDTREAQAAVEGLFGTEKTRVNWAVTSPSLPKNAVKILLNLSLLAGDALLRGGILMVAAEATDTAIDIVTQSEGTKVLLGEDLRNALRGNIPAADMQPRIAPAFLIRTLVDAAGGELSVSPPDAAVLTMGVRLPRAR